MTCHSERVHKNWVELEKQLLGVPESVEPEVIETQSEEAPVIEVF